MEVAAAGGLGSPPCAMLGPDVVVKQAAAYRERSGNKPLNLNFFCHAEAAGSGDFSPMWSGQSAALGRPIPARALTAVLAEEAQDLLRRLGTAIR